MKKYPPTSDEIREWMDRKGLSNKDVAKALCLSDGRVVRFWTSKKDPRPIPYPSWYTRASRTACRPKSQMVSDCGSAPERRARSRSMAHFGFFGFGLCFGRDVSGMGIPSGGGRP
jgi:hypothetical protein